MTAAKTFGLVTLGALAGMLLGGLFGLAAGFLAPGFFAVLIPWATLEPLGIATVLGAIAGISLGGGLAVFGILMQYLHEHHGRKSRS